jgi:hypothetical protein
VKWKQPQLLLRIIERDSILVYCEDQGTKWQSSAVVKPVLSKSIKKWGRCCQNKEHVDDRSVLTMWALVIGSLFVEATWLSNCTTRRFCNVCSTKNIQNNGRIRTAYFIMIMCWCTLLSQCLNFCHLNRARIFQHTFFNQFGPLFLWMNTATRVSFSRFPCNSGTIAWKQQKGCNFQDISRSQGQSMTAIHVTVKTLFQRCFH